VKVGNKVVVVVVKVGKAVVVVVVVFVVCWIVKGFGWKGGRAKVEGGAKVGGWLLMVSPLAWTMGAVSLDLGLPVTVLEMIRGRINPFRGWLSGPRPGWSK
jgi:hypothetical protein